MLLTLLTFCKISGLANLGESVPASKLVVPAISTVLDISNVAASSSPDIVIFLPPAISIFESVIIALLAITVPLVIPSIKLISAPVAVTAIPA